MPQAHAINGYKGVTKFLAVAAIAFVLYVARSICIPFALAILLSFLLAPVVSRLEKWHFSRVPAVLMAMTLILVLLVSAGWLVLGQLIQLADQLPQYQSIVHQKLEQLHPKPGSTLDRLNRTFEYYATEVEAIASQPGSSQPATSSATRGDTPDALVTQPAPKAIEVTLAKPRATGLDVLRNLAVRAFAPLSILGLVLILTLFMLIQREDIRDRMLRLIGRGQLHASTRTLDEASEKVSRYLLMQLIVNLMFGLGTFVGLYFIGVPNSPLWGLLATSLRFMPYFGVPAAALPPTALAFVTAPGFMGMILTFSLFAVLEILICYFVEPWLYGAKTGISPLAILSSAIFWGWIWGPVGLLLSTPLTVCLETIGRHVPAVAFLHVLFGDQPALTPELRFYQRLLVGDEEEATAIAEQVLKDSGLLALYDSLLLPALLRVEQDYLHGELQAESRRSFHRFVLELLAEFEDRHPDTARATGPVVLCIAASNDADDVAGQMLAGYLRSTGVQAHVMDVERLAGECVKQIEKLKPDIVCISAVPPHAVLHARYLCKRVRAVDTHVKLLAALWGASKEKSEEIADGIVTSIADAASRITSQRKPEVEAEHLTRSS